MFCSAWLPAFPAATTGISCANLTEAPGQVCKRGFRYKTQLRLQAAEARALIDLPEHPLIVPASAVDLLRVLDNLISNAALHNPPGTTIDIEAFSRAHVIQVKVNDDGNGIAAFAELHIFDAGFQAGSAAPGDRLGLSIVKNIIEQLGGAIRSREQ